MAGSAEALQVGSTSSGRGNGNRAVLQLAGKFRGFGPGWRQGDKHSLAATGIVPIANNVNQIIWPSEVVTQPTLQGLAVDCGSAFRHSTRTSQRRRWPADDLAGADC